MIFRYINGIVRPLNLDSNDAEEFEKNFSKLSDQNYCRPTKCPECGVNVYFIRHNGGSVWMDSLGYPWPKHGCFDNSKGYREIDILKSKIRTKGINFLGLVIKVDVKTFDTIIAIRCNDNRVRYYLLSGKQKNLLGQIVTVKRDNSKIIISTFKKNSIENYEIPSIDISEKTDLIENKPKINRLIKEKTDKTTANSKLEKRIKNQKKELNRLGIKFSNDMTSNELRELLRKEHNRRRELKKSSLIKNLKNLNIRLKGNEKFSELKELNKKFRNNKKKYLPKG